VITGNIACQATFSRKNMPALQGKEKIVMLEKHIISNCIDQLIPGTFQGEKDSVPPGTFH
jgi:hypothetical protein